ncbi:MAG: sulfur carrier protein ThiS [Clostridia bacterium]|nr:sulfur carrier protein ThiS [Clostridia bacterium]
MVVVLNGKQVEEEDGLSLHDMLLKRGIEPERVVVELNYEIVERIKWKDTPVKNGDRLEVLKFVGGG